MSSATDKTIPELAAKLEDFLARNDPAYGYAEGLKGWENEQQARKSFEDMLSSGDWKAVDYLNGLDRGVSLSPEQMGQLKELIREIEQLNVKKLAAKIEGFLAENDPAYGYAEGSTGWENEQQARKSFEDMLSFGNLKVYDFLNGLEQEKSELSEQILELREKIKMLPTYSRDAIDAPWSDFGFTVEPSLPERASNPAAAFAFLNVTRGIDKQILQEAYESGILYQGLEGKSCVFVGRDGQGNLRYGLECQRKMMSKGCSIRECEGCDKNYGFSMKPERGSDTLYIFNSPLDAMSHATIAKMQGQRYDNAHRLALLPGADTDKVVERYLLERPGIRNVTFCTGDDRMVSKQLAERYGVQLSSSPPEHKSINDDLLIMLSQQKGTHMEMKV